MEKKTFSNNGLDFAFYQTGSGEKELFIQHGYSDSSLCWGRLPQDLGQISRVTLMDARGHGESAKPKIGYDLTTMAYDMIALIKYLDMKKPVVIGHSMGGSLAAHLAALEPDLPGGVVLIDPGFRLRSDLQREEVINALREEMTAFKQMGVENVASQIRGKHPDWPDYFIQPSAQAKSKMAMEAINIFYTIDATWEEDLKKAACPILLITSDVSEGAIVSEETAEYARSLNSRVEILHIPSAGHSIHREKYQEVLSGITQFLKSI